MVPETLISTTDVHHVTKQCNKGAECAPVMTTVLPAMDGSCATKSWNHLVWIVGCEKPMFAAMATGQPERH